MKENIDSLIEKLDNAIDNLENYPPLKAMSILKEFFLEYNIPIKYIGKVALNVDSSFFDNEEKSRMSLMKLALLIMRMRNIILDGYGEDAEKIFSDVISGIGIVWKNG